MSVESRRRLFQLLREFSTDVCNGQMLCVPVRVCFGLIEFMILDSKTS